MQLREVEPLAASSGLGTHHISAPDLLALAKMLYHSVPRRAQILTIGAGSLDVGAGFSHAVNAALPKAQILLEHTIRSFLPPAA